jgi:S1-C subfamily serine protease
MSVAFVGATGPFARLDIHEGDRVLAVNGVRVYRENEFMQYLFEDDFAGDETRITLQRDGERHSIRVRPARLIQELQTLGEDPSLKLGLVLDSRRRDYLMVAAVLPRSPAYYSGVQPGDVVTVFDGQIVASSRDLAVAVEAAKPGEVELQVERDNRVRRLTVEVPNTERLNRRIANTRVDPDRRRQATISTDKEIDSSSQRLTPDAARPVLRKPADRE